MVIFFPKADFNEKMKVAAVFHEFSFSTDLILPPFPPQAHAAPSLAASADWLGQQAPFPVRAWSGCSRDPGEGPLLLPWADVISHQQESLVDSLVLSPLLPKSLLLSHKLRAVLPLEKMDMCY